MADTVSSKVDVNITVFKNKIAVPFKKAQFTLFTGEDGKYGIDTDKEVLEFAVKYDIVKKSGSWFSYGDTKLGQGRDAVKALIKDNPELADELEEKIKSRIKELAAE